MGNDIKQIGSNIGQRFAEFDTPNVLNERGIPLSLHQNIEDIQKLNELLLKNIINLGAKLQLDQNSISRNGHKWENNLVHGQLIYEGCLQEERISKRNENVMEIKNEENEVGKKEKGLEKEELFYGTEEKRELSENRADQANEKEKESSFKIVLTLLETYELKKMLEQYDKEENESAEKRRKSDGKICVICLDNKPEQVLPCAHAYCKSCIEIYVIENDKKCPMCRKSYKECLIDDIYQIVEWDEDFVDEMRSIFLKVLEKNNPAEVKVIRKLIENFEKEQ